ncbi:MAG: molybdopterin-dependent oxidoreductase [Lutibacter sp.]|uniref:molybdopterin-dependent oxidoreductase n=1 Tax=Lutibacter sp. TaxID=1925666 RepID=UPI0019EE2C77|nr:molybdopterin-dependent oxidoreductase [Lutibacter sp.]NOR28390.1 molybdopterin-dependent oxidoreductase [Lutibacter sp.]
MGTIKTHYRTCNLCEAMCGLEIKHKNNTIISIKGDKKDELSNGHICPKATALKDVYTDKNRLKTPIKRTNNGWKSITWNEAYDEIETELKRIQTKYGKNAIGSYRGNPTVHNTGLMLFGTPFLQSLGSNQKYTATSVDQLPHHFASLHMFGHYLMFPIPDIDRTDFMLIMGGNPAVSNGSIMTAPDFSNRLKAIKKRGGKVVVVDPRFTETSKIATSHFYIKPATDALLLLSLIHVIFEENLESLGHLSNHTTGLETLKKQAKNYAPKKTAKYIGFTSEEIKQLALDFATSKTAVCYGRMGLSTQEFGGLCQWLVTILNCITGNLDVEGGALFTKPIIDIVGMSKITGKTGSFNKYQSRVHKLPEFTGEFPVSTLADEILTPGKDQIKAMITIAGNPVLSTPNGKKLEKAFESLEFMVAIDIYLNETTKHANIILPTTTGLETALYDLVFHQFAIRNTAKYSEALFEKFEEQRHDWEILKELTKRFTGKENLLNLEQTLDYMLQFSSYTTPKISVNELKKHPHGIDYGALKPQLPERLFTADKKIALAHPLFIEDLKRLNLKLDKLTTEKNPKYPFSLIGRRHLRSNNSWMHNSVRLTKGKERCTLLINDKDASQLNLKDGQIVKVTSNVGEVQIPIEITNLIMAGVVSIPHGWGHHREGIKLKIAQQHAGVSLNDLTNEKNMDTLTGNADFSGTKVQISSS